MKKKLYNAINWFTDMLRDYGMACETSSFIRNTLADLYVHMLEDGTMIWDDDMVEKMYPQAADQIRRKEREKIFNELRYVVNDLNRRLDNGK